MTTNYGIGGATLTRDTGVAPPVIPHITGVALTNDTVPDDAGPDAFIGTLSATMSSGSFSGAFSFVANPGSHFTISGASLLVGSGALPTAPTSVDITVRALQDGNHWDEDFTISVVAPDTRITEAGDTRITEAGDTRVTE